nr:ferredoxin-2, mitochondrial [Tanacetum cinerariifolium]
MTIAGIHRLIRNPNLTLYSRAIISRSTTTSAAITSSSPSAKVSDRIVKLITYDPEDPASHRLEDIDACSAECEVNIAGEWFDKLPEPSYDEKYVLKRNARNRILNKHSRLGCQVVLTKEMQGMVVAVPEPKAWDTP